MATLALVHVNGVFRAHVLAGVGNAPLATVRNADLLRRAGVAGERDNVNQRLFKVLFGLRLAHFVHFLDGRANRKLVVRVLHVHAEREPDALFNDGAFQKHVGAVLGHFPRNHLVGNHVDPRQVAALVGQQSHFFEYAPADVVHRAVYASHAVISFAPRRRRR